MLLHFLRTLGAALLLCLAIGLLAYVLARPATVAAPKDGCAALITYSAAPYVFKHCV